MAPFVVDASVTVSWCFTDEPSEYGRAALTALENSYAVVPALWQFEVANALVSAERKKRITREGIERFFETLRLLLIYVERTETVWICQTTTALARNYRVTAYDAAYLDLARREGLALATLDEEMRVAASLLGVPAFQP